MNVRFTLHNVIFEWDNRKAVINFRNHEVSFELACDAFFDPFVCYHGDEVIDGELRETIVGLTSTWQLLFVVYVMRDDIIRVVSARMVTKAEREAYENQ